MRTSINKTQDMSVAFGAFFRSSVPSFDHDELWLQSTVACVACTCITRNEEEQARNEEEQARNEEEQARNEKEQGHFTKPTHDWLRRVFRILIRLVLEMPLYI